MSDEIPGKTPELRLETPSHGGGKLRRGGTNRGGPGRPTKAQAAAKKSAQALVTTRAVITLETHLAKLAEIRDKAIKDGAWSAAVAAERNRGDCMGLYVRKTLDLSKMSKDEIKARLLELLAWCVMNEAAAHDPPMPETQIARANSRKTASIAPKTTPWAEAQRIGRLRDERRQLGLDASVRRLALELGWSRGRAGELLGVYDSFPPTAFITLPECARGLALLSYRQFRGILRIPPHRRVMAAWECWTQQKEAQGTDMTWLRRNAPNLGTFRLPIWFVSCPTCGLPAKAERRECWTR